MTMKKSIAISLVKKALLTVAEIKAAVDAFDRGDSNVCDVLDAIIVAVEDYRAAGDERRDAA